MQPSCDSDRSDLDIFVGPELGFPLHVLAMSFNPLTRVITKFTVVIIMRKQKGPAVAG